MIKKELVLLFVMLAGLAAEAAAGDKVWGDFTGQVVQSSTRDNAKWWAATTINPNPVDSTGGDIHQAFRNMTGPPYTPIDAVVWSPNPVNLANPGRYMVVRFDLHVDPAYVQNVIEMAFEYQSPGGSFGDPRKRWWYVTPNLGVQTVIVDLENPTIWPATPSGPPAPLHSHYAFSTHETWEPSNLVQFTLRTGYWWAGDDASELGHAGNYCDIDLIAFVDDYTPYVPYPPMAFADYFVGLYGRKHTNQAYVWQYYGDEDTPSVRLSGDNYLTGDKKEVISSYYPRIGAYDTYDPDVAEYEILTAKSAGYAGFLCEWFKLWETTAGLLPADPQDWVEALPAKTVRRLGEVAADYDFMIGLDWIPGVMFGLPLGYVFGTHHECLVQLIDDLGKMVVSLRDMGVFPYIAGRPLITCWDGYSTDLKPVPPLATDKWLTAADLDEVRESLKSALADPTPQNPWLLSVQRDFFPQTSGKLDLDLEGHVDGFYSWHTMFAQSEEIWPWDQFNSREVEIEYLESFYSQCDEEFNLGNIGMFMGSFTPRFDSHKALSWASNKRLAIPDADERGLLTLPGTFDTIHGSTEARLTMASTWNDFAEATHIEPTREFGYRDVDMVGPDLWAANGWGTYNPALVRLPERLYQARRAQRLLEEAGVSSGTLTAAVAALNQAGLYISTRQQTLAEDELEAAEAGLGSLLLGDLHAHHIDLSWRPSFSNGIDLVWPVNPAIVSGGVALASQSGLSAGFKLTDAARVLLQGHAFRGTLTVDYLDSDGTYSIGVEGDSSPYRTEAFFKKKNSAVWRQAQFDIVNTDFEHNLSIGSVAFDLRVFQNGGSGAVKKVRLEGLSFAPDAPETGTVPTSSAPLSGEGAVAWVTQVSGEDVAGQDGQYPYDVDVTADGTGVIVTGEFWGTATFPGVGEVFSAGESDLFVARFDAKDGTCDWVTRAGGLYSDRGIHATIAGDGTITVKGTGFGEVFFSHTDALSVTEETTFEARYTSGGAYIASSAVVDPTDLYDAPARHALIPGAGEVMAGRFTHALTLGVGETNETPLESAGGEDIYVACFNAAGGLAWAEPVGGAGNDWPTSVASLPDGSGAFVVGCFEPDAGGVTFGTAPPTTLYSSGGADMFIARYATAKTFESIDGEDGWVREGLSGIGVPTGAGFTANATDSDTSALRAGDDNQKRQSKGIVSFDTSSLPDDAVITSAKLKIVRGVLVGTSPYSWPATCQVDIKTGAFSGSQVLQIGDFEAAPTSSAVASLSAAASDGQVSEGTLNSTGLLAVNKQGRTQFRIQFSSATDGDSVADMFGYYSGESATNPPVLELTYK